MPTRRQFLATSTATLLTPYLPAQLPSQTTRPNIAEIDRIKILAAASTALTQPLPTSFLAFTLEIPTLAAAAHIDPNLAPPCGTRAASLLRRAFVDRATAFPTTLPPEADVSASIVDRAALAEVLVALPFLPLPPDLRDSLYPWFIRYQKYLQEDRAALLVRDAKDHTASAWHLQSAAIARHLDDQPTLTALRHALKSTILRPQVRADGFFPHELTTPNPYRNSLFNLDLLAGLCQLLTTRFDLPWNDELPDGPGMRAVIARHAPFIASRTAWPFPADTALFNQLPLRRPALVFAARAFTQPDYVTIWRALPTETPTTPPEILTTLPIRQPLLWLTQPHPLIT